MAELKCIVVTPEATAVEAVASFVAVPLLDGEKGIAPGHAPLIGQLGSGELRLRHNSEITRYFINGGFVQVAENVVSVMTERAQLATKLDSEALREQLQHAISKPARSSDALNARDQAIRQLRAQVRVAQRVTNLR